MPKTGTPAVKTASSMPGAPSAYTLDGPPDRMIALGLPRQHVGDRHRVRHDLGVDPRLADAPRDELGVLGAEVDDEDQVVLCRLRHAAESIGWPPGQIVTRARSGREGDRALVLGSQRLTNSAEIEGSGPWEGA